MGNHWAALMCEGKRRYTRKEDAVREAERLSALPGHRRMGAYPCPVCQNWWHIGSAKTSRTRGRLKVFYR